MSTQYKHPRNGWSLRELAEKTGASRRSIIRWTSEPREDDLNRAQARRAKIRQLRSEGLSMRAIAKELNISVGTVHYSLNKADD
ncbi:winged helix-turn-helix transcriptional regulator [Corynebacterium stationis]|uniref:winged helix-turn-helix transcriptional regulator n=1 Tax=Corynebacterium stationis TaxID=1705 RepID=UPI00263B0B01|nr:helix-turn-helix domain-containing protein [Corynebacterium stationis]